jgi:hypothetical protein
VSIKTPKEPPKEPFYETGYEKYRESGLKFPAMVNSQTRKKGHEKGHG